MTLAFLAERTSRDHLEIFGAFHTEPSDGIGDGTLAMLGPREPGFWRHVTETPEFTDGDSDPLDRWSRRVVEAIASDLGGRALFPFGRPAHPFHSWALRTGRAWTSPVVLLVHETAGLLVSYRGAILLPGRLPLPRPAEKPCDTCKDKPCLTACPVSAMTGEGYDLPACHNYLDTAAGRECLTGGCAVRHACPVSQTYKRASAQSEFHMRHFHP